MWESNPRPLVPKTRIIPLDQWPINHMSIIRAPRIELGTYCVLSNRHNQLDQARISYMIQWLAQLIGLWKQQQQKKKIKCVDRESNPDLVLGRHEF